MWRALLARPPGPYALPLPISAVSFVVEPPLSAPTTAGSSVALLVLSPCVLSSLSAVMSSCSASIAALISANLFAQNNVKYVCSGLEDSVAATWRRKQRKSSKNHLVPILE